MFHYLREWHLVRYLAKYFSDVLQVSSRRKDYALNSGFVSSIDSSTEIESVEIFPANIRHDRRNYLGTANEIEIYPLNLTQSSVESTLKVA